MLLAIDLGNSEIDVGVWDGQRWTAMLRRRTTELVDGSEFGAWLADQLGAGITASIVSSVVPSATDWVLHGVLDAYGLEARRLVADPKLKMEVCYDPPSSLGTDRLANALAAREIATPIVVVDVGTATTFEAVDASGNFVGGAIMPGPRLAAAALAKGTAALPEAAVDFPPDVLGDSTLHALQSGIMLGHAAAIQGLASQMSNRLGGAKVIATGGLGEQFLSQCPILEGFYPTLTLDGLVTAHQLLS